jgi:MoxR-like ATPase
MAEVQASSGDVQAVKELRQARETIEREIGKVIIGQKKVIEELLVALLANGHALIVGVPGLAKTLLINTLAQVLSLSFNRIQFTPDLMPSDITGTDILEDDPTTRRRAFKFVRGPVFANIVLADEINRTPPKTQAALLQAMQERKVTAGGQTYPLDPPFFVLATQNPIEQEGTYPLPEAQLDRFMFEIIIDYPSEAEEAEIVRSTTSAYEAQLSRVLSGEDILRLQKLVRRVPVSDHVVGYAVQLARKTRPRSPDAPKFIRDWLSWGAGPRASQYLILGAKTQAVLDGRFSPGVEDVRAVAPSVLRHRLVTNFSAEADGITAGDIVDRLLASGSSGAS